MKYLTSFALSLAALSCHATGHAEWEWADYGEKPMENPQYMADMTEAGAPGPEHEALTRRAGSWKVEGEWRDAPDGEAAEMVATAETIVLHDGRFLFESYKSEFMGMPFEGTLMQGYDNVKKRYWSLWTDNVSTGNWISYGTETSPGNYELVGTASDILTPKGRSMRMTITVHDEDSYTMRMFDTRPGTSEFITMELRYTRE